MPGVLEWRAAIPCGGVIKTYPEGGVTQCPTGRVGWSPIPVRREVNRRVVPLEQREETVALFRWGFI
jgi:hypothetical protein